MSPLATIPTRRQLEREAMHDALLRADMRNEAACEVVGAVARRVFRWSNIFGAIGLPLICGVAVFLIHVRWPI